MRRRLFWFWLAMFVALPAHGQPSLLATLQTLRATYPTPMSKEQIGELLTRAAQSSPGFVLLSKPQGNNCPAMGTRVSCDYLVWAATGQGFDVLQDSEGAAVPRWNRGTSGFPSSRFVAVTSAPPPIVVPPPPVTPPVNLVPILTAIGELTALVKTQEDTLAALQRTLDDVRKQQQDDRADVVAWLKKQQDISDGSGRAWWQILLGLGR